MLIAPFWTTRIWVLQPLLSQMGGQIWNLNPQPLQLWVWPLRGQSSCWSNHVNHHERQNPLYKLVAWQLMMDVLSMVCWPWGNTLLLAQCLFICCHFHTSSTLQDACHCNIVSALKSGQCPWRVLWILFTGVHKDNIPQCFHKLQWLFDWPLVLAALCQHPFEHLERANLVGFLLAGHFFSYAFQWITYCTSLLVLYARDGVLIVQGWHYLSFPL